MFSFASDDFSANQRDARARSVATKLINLLALLRDLSTSPSVLQAVLETWTDDDVHALQLAFAAGRNRETSDIALDCVERNAAWGRRYLAEKAPTVRSALVRFLSHVPPVGLHRPEQQSHRRKYSHVDRVMDRFRAASRPGRKLVDVAIVAVEDRACAAGWVAPYRVEVVVGDSLVLVEDRGDGAGPRATHVAR